MTDVLTKLERNISVNNPAFEELTDVEKMLARDLVANHSEFLIKDLPLLIYDMQPPTIEEFLTYEWIGHSAKSLFPKWRQVLCEDVFGPHSVVKEVIFTGATGTGKSMTAQKCILYNLVRVLCFKTPQLIFGSDLTTVMSNVFISVYKEKAYRQTIMPMLSLMRESPKFVEVRKGTPLGLRLEEHIPFYEDRDIIYLPKNMMIYSGSQLQHTIGEALIGAVLEEVEYRKSKNIVGEGLEVYLTMKERIEGRFMDVPWTMACLVCSGRSSEGVIPTYVNERVKQGDKKVVVFSFALWEVKHFDAYTGGYFHVLKGNKVVPSRVMSDEETKLIEADKFHMPRNCKLIKVPEAHRQSFEANVDRALMNLAGEVAIDDLYLFDTYTPFEDYVKELCPELHMTADLMKDTKLIDQIPKEYIQRLTGEVKYLTRAPNEVRYGHVDLAVTTEAGICVVHKELGEDNSVLVVVDFIIRVTSPTRIDIETIMNFFIDLEQELNVRFGVLTADKFQSVQMLQGFAKKKVAKKVESLSIGSRGEKTLQAYHRAAAQVNQNLIRMGHAPVLLRQAKALRESNGQIITRLRKDELDAFVGAVYNAIGDVKTEPAYSFTHLQSSTISSKDLREDEFDEVT